MQSDALHRKKETPMKKKGTLLLIAGFLLIAAAGGFAVNNMLISTRAGEASREILEVVQQQIAAAAPVAPAESAPDAEPQVSAAPEAVPEEPADEEPTAAEEAAVQGPVMTAEECIGVLKIPSLGLELPVFRRWDYALLRWAPCRFTGSPETGDLTICAHNYSYHFGHLKELPAGASVSFTDMSGTEYRYRVEKVEILEPTATERMVDSEWELSLFTCTIGGKTRVTVRCRQESDTPVLDGTDAVE